MQSTEVDEGDISKMAASETITVLLNRLPIILVPSFMPISSLNYGMQSSYH